MLAEGSKDRGQPKSVAVANRLTKTGFRTQQLAMAEVKNLKGTGVGKRRTLYLKKQEQQQWIRNSGMMKTKRVSH